MGRANYFVYEDSEIPLSPLSSTSSNTNIQVVAGAETWCISVPESASAHPELLVQVNYSRFYMDGQGIVSPVRASVSTPADPYLPKRAYDANFENNWITLASFSSGETYFYTDQPARFIRLKGTITGDGINSASANFGNAEFTAFVWSTSHLHGS